MTFFVQCCFHRLRFVVVEGLWFRSFDAGQSMSFAIAIQTVSLCESHFEKEYLGVTLFVGDFEHSIAFNWFEQFKIVWT